MTVHSFVLQYSSTLQSKVYAGQLQYEGRSIREIVSIYSYCKLFTGFLLTCHKIQVYMSIRKHAEQ